MMDKKFLSLIIFMILLAAFPMKVHAKEERWLTTGSFNLTYLYPDFISGDAPDPSTVDASFNIYGDLISPESSLYTLHEEDHVIIEFRIFSDIPTDSPYDFELGWGGLELCIYNNSHGNGVWTSLSSTGLNLPLGANTLILDTYEGTMHKALFEYYMIAPSDWDHFVMTFGFTLDILVGELGVDSFRIYFSYHIDLKEWGRDRTLTFEFREEKKGWGIGDILSTTNLMYIFMITTVILVVTTVYFARRKTKVKPEEQNIGET